MRPLSRRTSQGAYVFALIWFGQLASLTGSGLTSFALGVWVYQRNGSVMQFALTVFFIVLPRIGLSPLAGTLVDRWDRRWAMILSDSGAGFSSLVIALMLFSNQLQVWQVYVLVAISSAFNTFRWPAYAAATSLLIPKVHYGRANGMVQLADSMASLVSPVIAGFLMVTIGIEVIMLGLGYLHPRVRFVEDEIPDAIRT